MPCKNLGALKMKLSREKLVKILNKQINIKSKISTGITPLCQVLDADFYVISKKKYKKLLKIIHDNGAIINTCDIILVSQLDEHNISISIDTYWFSTVNK